MMTDPSLASPSPLASLALPETPPALSPWSLALRRFMRNRLAIVGLFLLALIVLVAVAGPLFVDRDLANRPQPAQMLQDPSEAHPLGTDEVGRDVLARVIYAAGISVPAALAAMVVTILLGTLLGTTAGYYGGALDQVLMRVTDAMLSIPSIFILLMIAAVVRPSVPVIVVVIGLLNWMDLARLLRGQTMSLRQTEYVDAARALGAGDAHILLRHIIPNLVGLILVAAPLVAGRALLTESALSFLGLGVQPPTPTWGNMLNQAQQHLLNAPGLAVSPGVMIMLTVISINFIGDGLRDAFDPKVSK